MRKRGKGVAASPPQGRGRRNRSPTNWKMRHPSCNDKNKRFMGKCACLKCCYVDECISF